MYKIRINIFFPLTMCPWTKVLRRCIPWTMRPLDDSSVRRSVLWMMSPLDDASQIRNTLKKDASSIRSFRHIYANTRNVTSTCIERNYCNWNLAHFLHAFSAVSLFVPCLDPLTLHLGSHRRALLVSQDRRHLFVTPWRQLMKAGGGALD